MADVLVLVDHTNGKLRKVSAELLTLARRLGTPSAVFIGEGVQTAQPTLAKYGAEKVYVYDNPDALTHLVAPQSEVLAHLVEVTGARAVLIPSNPVGKVLIIDKFLSVARYGGDRRFADGKDWAHDFVRNAALALGRDTIRVDVSGFSISY